MKRTQEDEQFGLAFAAHLRPFYERALANGETEARFAKRLGVNRGGLQRYLRKHATPSLRTVVFAYREFGFVVPYAGVDIRRLVSGKGRKKYLSDQFQMNLPLTIEAPEGEMELVVSKKSAQRYRLQLRVKKVG